MDKLVLGFLADMLYVKSVICFEEYEDIMHAKQPSDLDPIIDKMLRGEYNAYRKGESYDFYGRK